VYISLCLPGRGVSNLYNLEPLQRQWVACDIPQFQAAFFQDGNTSLKKPHDYRAERGYSTVKSWNLGKCRFYQAVQGADFPLGYGALGGVAAASTGAGAVFPKLAQNLGNLTGYSRIEYQGNNQIGWTGLYDRLFAD